MDSGPVKPSGHVMAAEGSSLGHHLKKKKISRFLNYSDYDLNSNTINDTCTFRTGESRSYYNSVDTQSTLNLKNKKYVQSYPVLIATKGAIS